MFYALAFMLGAILGISVFQFIYCANKIGSINIDNSDNEPHLFLEISKDDYGLRNLSRKKYAIFKVKKRNYISQK